TTCRRRRTSSLTKLTPSRGRSYVLTIQPVRCPATAQLVLQPGPGGDVFPLGNLVGAELFEQGGNVSHIGFRYGTRFGERGHPRTPPDPEAGTLPRQSTPEGSS